MSEELDGELDVGRLALGLPGVSPVRGAQHAEAASISFHRQGHSTGSQLRLMGIVARTLRLRLQTITVQMDRSWRDEEEATEDGASGIAFLLVLRMTEYTVIERSAKGTGIDYWLAHADADLPFQRAARLECSGIARGDESVVRTRVRKKTKRAATPDGSLPAYICVTEFGTPMTVLVRSDVASS